MKDKAYFTVKASTYSINYPNMSSIKFKYLVFTHKKVFKMLIFISLTCISDTILKLYFRSIVMLKVG